MKSQEGVGSPPLAQMLAGPVTEDLVMELLGDVIDPELGVDIVNLGLVYAVRVEADAVVVRMTLTTPGCPLGGYLDDEVGRSLAQLPGSPAVSVDLVWDPPWCPVLMTEEAKRLLGGRS
jgi:metal-sulfur cluster biosynthetic enzyme